MKNERIPYRVTPWVSSVASCLLLILTSSPARAWVDTPIHEEVLSEQQSDLQLIEALRAFIPTVMRANEEPGLTIAVARRGKVIWKAGFGYRELAGKVEMLPDSVFKSGSMGKTFTAVALMQLVEQGVVELDAPADRYLPFKVVNPLGNRPVTVRDLMTHQSGLAEGDSAISQFDEPRPLEAALRDAYHQDFHPFYGGRLTPLWTAKVGSKWQYSNLGVATLGLVVERTNKEGLSFSDYVQKHVIDPLGMTSTQYPPVQDQKHVRPEIWSRMMQGYARLGAVYIPTPPIYLEGFPAGGLVSTVSDHMRLLLALMNGGQLGGQRILSEASVRAMTSPQSDLPTPLGHKQGLIWWIENYDTPSYSFFHGGSHMYGWTNNFAAFPKLDVAVALSTNQWALPQRTGTRALIPRFIMNWVALEQHRSERQARPNATWKTSYVMGLIFAEALNGDLGARRRLGAREIRTLADRAVLNPDGAKAAAGWNEGAFLAAFRDLDKVPMTPKGLADFRRSGQMKVSFEEALAIYRELGGGKSVLFDSTNDATEAMRKDKPKE